jgi:hypothetical protein
MRLSPVQGAEDDIPGYVKRFGAYHTLYVQAYRSFPLLPESYHSERADYGS